MLFGYHQPKCSSYGSQLTDTHACMHSRMHAHTQRFFRDDFSGRDGAPGPAGPCGEHGPHEKEGLPGPITLKI